MNNLSPYYKCAYFPIKFQGYSQNPHENIPDYYSSKNSMPHPALLYYHLGNEFPPAYRSSFLLLQHYHCNPQVHYLSLQKIAPKKEYPDCSEYSHHNLYIPLKNWCQIGVRFDLLILPTRINTSFICLTTSSSGITTHP